MHEVEDKKNLRKVGEIPAKSGAAACGRGRGRAGGCGRERSGLPADGAGRRLWSRRGAEGLRAETFGGSRWMGVGRRLCVGAFGDRMRRTGCGGPAVIGSRLGGGGRPLGAVAVGVFGAGALDPDEPHAVAAVEPQEAHPQIGVLLAGEALLDPAEDPPLRDGVDDVFRVGVDGHVGALELERFEGRADGHELHAVVGRQAEARRELLAVGTREQHDAVAARAGVSEG